MNEVLKPEKFELPFAWNAPKEIWEKKFPDNIYKLSFGMDSFTEKGYESSGQRMAGWFYLFEGSYRIEQFEKSVDLQPGFRVWIARGKYRTKRLSDEVPYYLNLWDKRDIFPKDLWIEIGLPPRE